MGPLTSNQRVDGSKSLISLMIASDARHADTQRTHITVLRLKTDTAITLERPGAIDERGDRRGAKAISGQENGRPATILSLGVNGLAAHGGDPGPSPRMSHLIIAELIASACQLRTRRGHTSQF
jgi:hypothetical protein